ncbi:undecaprenyl/decaprenyl-phosphate alpha-N-acetylglucosaminyl 1-phosphate transferase [Candidatus Gracilibacteria bacterium]|nr:undecaprenyl/decaprenyl-phosphate alpha-N-acetylglucosaminyl 1-phosphate transferase [Candidatus Gracilibacteria bacterium]
MLILQCVIIFMASLIISPLILRGVSFLLTRYSILDRPHLYKSEIGRKPAPYGAGIAIIITLLVLSPFIFIFAGFSSLLEHRLMIILIIGILIGVVSFIDDLDTIGKSPISIPPIARLLMQIGVGAIIGLTSIKISYMSSIIGGIIPLDEWYWSLTIGSFAVTIYWIPILVTIAWYVIVFNAVNFSDGVPGLTGGYALITFIILASLAVKLYITDTTLASEENSRFLLVLLAIIIPITYALTRADISRRLIMGDSGTIMLAFLIATLAIIAGGKIATAISVLGLYLIDFIYVITVRLLHGQNPMRGDQTHHLHFRLMELGLSQSQIRFIVYFLTSVFGVAAIFLTTIGKIILFVIIAGVTIFLTEILEKVKKK